MEDLKAALKREEATKAAEEKERKLLQAEIAELTDKLESVSAAKAKADRTIREQDGMLTKSAFLELLIFKQIQDELADLTAQLEGMENSAEVDELRRKLNAELAALQAKLDAEASGRVKAERARGDLQKELAAVQGLISETEAGKKTAENSRKSLEAELLDIQARLDAASKEKEQVKKSKKKLAAKVKELQFALESAPSSGLGDADARKFQDELENLR